MLCLNILQRGFLLITVGLVLAPLTFWIFRSSAVSKDIIVHRPTLVPNKVRVCCLVHTAPKFFYDRALAINSTWGSRCDGLFFITELSNDTKGLPIAPIANITPGYEHLTQKSRLAFQYAYRYHFNNFDWFLKTDDDTYIIMENLKSFLSKKNTFQPVTFGYGFKDGSIPHGYHSGGAGYVLSREALKRFNQAYRESNIKCVEDGGSEDMEVAKCLRSKGVYPGRSVDDQRRARFIPIKFSDHFMHSLPKWYTDGALISPITVSCIGSI